MNGNKNTKQIGGGRIQSLDWLSGLLIVHMILGHISQGHFAQVEDAPFFVIINRYLFFFMPWFFFKSGMFFKPDVNKKSFFIKSFKRLMIPFCIFSLLGEPLYWIHVFYSEHSDMWQWYLASAKTIFTHGNLQGNGPLWFLLSLFLVRIFYNRFFLNTGLKIAIASLSVTMLCLLHYYNIAIYPSVSHTVAGLVFYAAGDLMRNLQYNKAIFIVSTIVMVALYVYCPIDTYILYGNSVLPESNYYWIFLYAVVTIIFVHNVLKHIPTIVLKYVPLQVIGKDSMTYYVTHLLVLFCVRIICADILQIEQWTYFWIMVIVCVFTLPLLGRLFTLKPYRNWVGA